MIKLEQKLRNVIAIAICLAVISVFTGCEKDSKNNDDNNDPYVPGDGSASKPFLVANVADLKRIGTGEESQEGLWKRDKHYRQIANINLSGENTWTPIPVSYSFDGKYDGGGFTISNLHDVIGDGNNSGKGLFGTVSGAVTNVRLIGVDITGYMTIGGIAASVGNGGTIEHCFVDVINIEGDMHVGGITGGVSNGGKVRSCIVVGKSVIANSNQLGIVGGVAGVNNGMIQNCYTTVDVTSTYRTAGGIVGSNGSGTVQYCYATGNILATGAEDGGIAGRNNKGTVKNCVALNREIERSNSPSNPAAPYVGRISSSDEGTLSNNYAREDMLLIANSISLPVSETSVTGNNGADVSFDDYAGANSNNWWSSTAKFPTSEWSFDKNRLPWLKGFDGLTQNPNVN